MYKDQIFLLTAAFLRNNMIIKMILSDEWNKSGRRVSWIVWGIFFVLLFTAGAVIGFLLAPRKQTPTGPSFKVMFLHGKVGGGTLINYSGNKYLILNPGSSSDSDHLTSYLGKKNIKSLTVIITEDNPDLYGGLDALIDTFPVTQVIYPEKTKADAQWKSSLSRVRERGIRLYAVGNGDDILISKDTVLQILSPTIENSSTTLVGRLVYKDTTFLLASRLTPKEENALVKYGQRISSDLFYCPSSYYRSASLELISSVRPKFCITSLPGNRRNLYSSISKRLNPENTGAELFTTTRNNGVTCFSDGNDISCREGD